MIFFFSTFNLVFVLRKYVLPNLPGTTLNNILLLGGLAIFLITFFSGIAEISGYSLKDLLPTSATPPYDPASPIHIRYRQILIQRVWDDWIEGIYKKSLDYFTRLDLEMEAVPEAVPCQSIYHSPEMEREPIGRGVSILEIYNKAKRHLLILGEPGSGKTTKLLELATDLLKEAKEEDGLPIPIVLNLSSFRGKYKSLAEWIIERLHLEYGVNRKLGKTWIEADLLLPLLDGLDEVKGERCDACVNAINIYIDEHSLTGLVVCSRAQEYEQLSVQLNLQRAIEIQEIPFEEVKEYLKEGGVSTQGLRDALELDEGLQELARSPLTLKVMGMAYKGQSTASIVEGKEESTPMHQRIFRDYIKEMFRRPRPGATTKYSDEETVHYLARLARQIENIDQSEFYMEQIQQSWLQEEQLVRKNNHLRFRFYLLVGLSGGLLVGLSGGVIFGLIGGLLVGLFVGLLVGLLVGWNGVLIVWVELQEKEFLPVEQLSFSWAEAIKSLSIKTLLIGGLIFGLVAELLGGLIFRQFGGQIYVLIGVLAVLTWGLTIGLLGGLKIKQIEERNILGQGVKNSLKNWLIFGLLSGLLSSLSAGLIGVLIFGLIDGLIGMLIVGLIIGLVWGLIVGLVLGLDNGGAFILNHFFIKTILQQADYIPRPYIDFLDYAVERNFLYKKGGGYIFIHRMLMEFFTGLEMQDEEEHKAAKAPTSA
jgi:hypothetical protein